jgi:hypothetical protein
MPFLLTTIQSSGKMAENKQPTKSIPTQEGYQVLNHRISIQRFHLWTVEAKKGEMQILGLVVVSEKLIVEEVPSGGSHARGGR